MVSAAFPYPGGKSRYASWILDLVPEHRCFVEVFGGAAGVLVNKDPDTSKVEVYNDRDRDLVQFFEVLRERTEELSKWLDAVPYAREVHKKWANLYYDGYRPADPIQRAGRFFYLRYSQFGGGYDSPNGFATAKTSSRAQSFSNKIGKLDEFARRFDDVVIENLDWQVAVEKYDSPETVFYLDPPYVGTEHYYPVNAVDHEEVMDVLASIDGDAICSYSDLPEGAEQHYLLEREGERTFINNGLRGNAKETTERLLCNFQPEVVE